MKTIYELPPFDTGLYEGCDFGQSNGHAFLTIHVAEHGNLTIEFVKPRFYRYTALPNCTPEMASAYFKLVEMTSSSEVRAFIKSDTSNQRAYGDLHHFLIFLDETGCYEVFSESVKLPNMAMQTDATGTADL
jgi:hypothetical protein